ncbi:MAG: hypothetical protein DME49_01980 [Verrucomicrobia bacterium]|nr:MAG: hypothetical protein DME49_01980 [Verrucomicrobiota bacterium]
MSNEVAKRNPDRQISKMCRRRGLKFENWNFFGCLLANAFGVGAWNLELPADQSNPQLNSHGVCFLRKKSWTGRTLPANSSR